MNAVGLLGNYISQGVYTVAGPFHPFGGAVDIIVVQQEDGTFKSSPWYVKFGKFQGVLKRSEKLVAVAVNDIDVGFHMYLDATGEAYFLKDAELDKEELSLSPPSGISSGDEASLEPLALEAAKSENGSAERANWHQTSSDDGGKGNSNEEKAEDLELGFEDTKASLLPVQQVQAVEDGGVSATVLTAHSEDGVVADTAHLGEEREPGAKISDAEKKADGGNVVKVMEQTADNYPSSALQIAERPAVGVKRAEGGAAIHALLNHMVGLDGSNGSGSGALVANAALAALSKAAIKPDNHTSFSSSSVEVPSFTGRLESAMVDARPSEGLGNRKDNSSADDTEGLHSVKAARDTGAPLWRCSTSLESHPADDMAVGSFEIRSYNLLASLRRVKSESALGIYENGMSSPSTTGLKIASADGVVFLETPPGVVRSFSLANGQQQDHSPQEVGWLQEEESQEPPKRDSKVLLKKGGCKLLESPVHGLVLEVSRVMEFKTDTEQEPSRDEKVKSYHVNDTIILNRSASELQGDTKQEIGGLADVACQMEAVAVEESLELKASPGLLPPEVNDEDLTASEKQLKNVGQLDGFQGGRGSNLKGTCANVPNGSIGFVEEKKQGVLEVEGELGMSSEQQDGLVEGTEVFVTAPQQDFSHTSVVEVLTSPRLQTAVDTESTWPYAVGSASDVKYDGRPGGVISVTQKTVVNGEETLVLETSPQLLPEVDGDNQGTTEKEMRYQGQKTDSVEGKGPNLKARDITPMQESIAPIVEKRPGALGMQWEQAVVSEKLKTLQQKNGLVEGKEVIVASPMQEISEASVAAVVPSLRLKDSLERELAWRDAVGKAAAALKVAPLCAKSNQLSQGTEPGAVQCSPKRLEYARSPPQSSSSPEAVDRRSGFSNAPYIKSTASKSVPEQEEKRSWGWWGWRGTSTSPSKPPSKQDGKKETKDAKRADGRVKQPKLQDIETANVKGQAEAESPRELLDYSSTRVSGENFAKSVASDADRSPREGNLQNVRSVKEDEDAGSLVGTNKAALTLKNGRSKDRWNEKKTVSTSILVDEKKQNDEHILQTVSSNTIKGRDAALSRRRSILGRVFQPYEGGPHSAASSVKARPGEKGGDRRQELSGIAGQSSLERAEIISDLLDSSWGYGRRGKTAQSWSTNVSAVAVDESSHAKSDQVGAMEDSQKNVPSSRAASNMEEVNKFDFSGAKENSVTDKRIDLVPRTLNQPSGGSSREGTLEAAVVSSSAELSVHFGDESCADVLRGVCDTMAHCMPSQSVEMAAGDKWTDDVTNQVLVQELEGDKVQGGSSSCEAAVDVDVGLESSEEENVELSSNKSGGEFTAAHGCSAGRVDGAASGGVGNRGEDGCTGDILPEESSVDVKVVCPIDGKKEVSFVNHGPLGDGSQDRCSFPLDLPVMGPSATCASVLSPSPEVVSIGGNGLILMAPIDLEDELGSNDGEDKLEDYREGTADESHSQGTTPPKLLHMVSSVKDGALLDGPVSDYDAVYESTPQLQDNQTHDDGAVDSVEIVPVTSEVLETIRGEVEYGEAREMSVEENMEQEESQLEDELGNVVSNDLGGASRKSLYFDAITSEEEEDEGQASILSGEDDRKQFWDKSSPIGIPVGLQRSNSRKILQVVRDGSTFRPLSLPDVRSQSSGVHLLESTLSRSVGSEPLSHMQTELGKDSSSEALARSPAESPQGSREGFKHSNTEEGTGITVGSGRSVDESAGEEGVALDDGEDRVVETGIELSLCGHLLKERMGSEEAADAFASTKVSLHEFRSAGASIVTNDNLVVRVGGQYYPWSVVAPLVLGILAFGQVVMPEIEGAIPVERPALPPSSKATVGPLVPTASGGWKLWPFPLRRPKTPERNILTSLVSREALLVTTQGVVQSPLMNYLVLQNGYYKSTRRNKVRTIVPSSQMLASMNLKEGSNRITFTFFTRVLGKQQVDARVYLWKWNTRIVISDVDGTITKSDVLGQVMPLVGRDWTQSGVARLFSAIKDNGYELMFLSARAISQAYLTRQFLFNIKQDGEALPDGPVVISPDGLFPSLYREVIRRAPHEFKIACLQDIRSLFPQEYNPFYAGFGNRETDELSYMKVGIPKGKIFMINPKGEVAVNNRIDVKTYTSLHKLVDDMFPAMTYTEQEDYNSWNYWKIPLPNVDADLNGKSAVGSSSKRM